MQELTCKIAPTDAIPALHGILNICGEYMHRVQGMSHWYPYRPLERFQTEFDRIYALYAGDMLIGTFNVKAQPRPYYTPDLWSNPDARALYMGGLGILPHYQGKGIGAWAMQQADSVAQADGFDAIRFDGVANNQRLITFYDRLGYRRCGVVGKHDNWPGVMCYERVFA